MCLEGMACDSEVLAFLQECEKSGDQAYNALKDVLGRLQKEETRVQARVLLASAQSYIDSQVPAVDSLAVYHFKIHHLSLSNYEGFRENGRSLTLLELPSIFIPEDWSFTFFEGINRLPDTGFRDRDIAELGCGNGWISLAVAQKWSPRKVYGLDINPRAVKAAWINLYLNALDSNGALILDHEGKSLLDRVEFHESDLLGYCKSNNITLDRVIGCIPQILNPDPDAMQKIVSENASEEFLYSLSNYCALQGFVEDQFGLGLIARAVEEGIGVVKSTGSLILNIGGRPGQAVCERLFKRRGFQISKVWQTRVNQAADTDILALVEIEKNSHHCFEFFMGKQSEEPINARTAWAYAKAGGQISHGLSVYSCQLQHPNQVKTIYKFLSRGEFQETRSALDLSFEDESVAEEKIPFVANLACALEEFSHIPDELPAGCMRFRNLIAGFLHLYHNIPIGSNNLIVFPSRSAAIEGFLHLFSPALSIVDATLTRHLPKKWVTATPKVTDAAMGNACKGDVIVIEAPKRTDLVIQLMEHLKPQVVVTSLAHFEMRSSTSFHVLVDSCARFGSRLLLDISDYMELSSMPGTNGVLQYMAAHTLPLHVTIVCGLVRNKVYSDLEAAFIISENRDVLNAMAKTGELLNGPTSALSQFYYGCLFYELLTFQLPERHTTKERSLLVEEGDNFIKMPENVLAVVNETELLSVENSADDLIRMDFDVNRLPVPPLVKMAVFEGFARQNIAETEMDLTVEISEFLRLKLGILDSSWSELILSDSSTALFTKLVMACVARSGTLIFPSGSNGSYVSAAKLLYADVKIIPTRAEEGFKVTAEGIDGYLSSVKNPWVYISGPTVNPTGMTYSDAEIHSILESCQKHGARVILDTSFSGLEFESNGPLKWNLGPAIMKGVAEEDSPFAVAIIGSLSGEILTGGLELSFAALADPIFVNAFRDCPNMSCPHGTLRYSMKKLLGLSNRTPDTLHQGLLQQREILRDRSEQMLQVLKHCGWEPLKPLGGVSMVARPLAYEGKLVSYKNRVGQVKEVQLTSTNIREAILYTTGLCISSSSWTCIPNYCRFVIALEEENFRKALKALESFRAYVFGN